jgi:hypothetical protein
VVIATSQTISPTLTRPPNGAHADRRETEPGQGAAAVGVGARAVDGHRDREQHDARRLHRRDGDVREDDHGQHPADDGERVAAAPRHRQHRGEAERGRGDAMAVGDEQRLDGDPDGETDAGDQVDARKARHARHAGAPTGSRASTAWPPSRWGTARRSPP